MTTITKLRAEASTIGQLSKRTGVAIETIRYYERIKLLPAPPRTAGGHRSYADGHVRRLRFVRRARELGFGIDNIRALIALAEQEPAPCHDARAIAAAHLADVRNRLADLAALERSLAATVEQCDAQCRRTPAPACPVLDALQA